MKGRWEVCTEYRVDTDEIEALLDDGWEPFAVSQSFYHFRRWTPTPPRKGKVVDEAPCRCGKMVLPPDVLSSHSGATGHHARDEPCRG